MEAFITFGIIIIVIGVAVVAVRHKAKQEAIKNRLPGGPRTTNPFERIK